MATTDPKLASAALHALSDVGVRFAVLHREKDIAAETLTSDLDLVIEGTPEKALASAWPALVKAGIHPVVAFPYEVDELTVFLCDRRSLGAAQIDLLGDSKGMSLFGMRSEGVVGRAVDGARWPTAHPLDELLYLTRKRQVKEDAERVEGLRALALSYRWDELRVRAGELFVAPIAEAVLGALAGGLAASPYRPTAAYRARTLRRRVRRLRQPVGFWVELVADGPEGARLAADLAGRFARFLVTVRAVERPTTGPQFAWWCSSVAPVRWRPGLVVSSTVGTRRPEPDLVLAAAGADVEQLTEQTVDGMQRRVKRWLDAQ